MRWVLEWVGRTARLAWWDGSCLDLRLHRLGDLIDFVATPPEPVHAFALSRPGRLPMKPHAPETDAHWACAEAPSAEDALAEALRRAFWTSLNRAPLPAMQALEIAARTVGALYRQVARAHEGSNGCGCGWEPDPDGDLIVLEANLAAALLQPPEPSLARMTVAGRA